MWRELTVGQRHSAETYPQGLHNGSPQREVDSKHTAQVVVAILLQRQKRTAQTVPTGTTLTGKGPETGPIALNPPQVLFSGLFSVTEGDVFCDAG